MDWQNVDEMESSSAANSAVFVASVHCGVRRDHFVNDHHFGVVYENVSWSERPTNDFQWDTFDHKIAVPENKTMSNLNDIKLGEENENYSRGGALIDTLANVT